MSRAAIAGDIAGSRFEGTLWEGDSLAQARCVGAEWPGAVAGCRGEGADFEWFHPASAPTDDSILLVATIEWLLDGGDARPFLKARFRRAPRPELFGQFFRAWAQSEGDAPCGSIGNGAAMRVAPVAFAARSLEQTRSLARQNALATHAGEDALIGAEAVAAGVFLARCGADNDEIRRELSRSSGYDLDKPLDEWRSGFRFSSACAQTVPVALRAFLEAVDHENAVRAAVSLGGDTDTLACMAGALAGARWGIPASVAEKVAKALGDELLSPVRRFEAQFPDALRLALPTP